MANNFFRLISFLVNICPEPLRKLFMTKAKADTSTSFTTLDSYLASKRSQIVKKLYRDQYDLLYPVSGQVDENEWDITLLSFLINKLYGSSLSYQDLISIDEIKKVRDHLQHLPNASNIDDTQFENIWNCLETATLQLADIQGPDYKKNIKDKIDKARKENISDQVNIVCKWFQEVTSELRRDVKEISSSTKEIQKNASENKEILQSTIIDATGPDGQKLKRMKIYNEELKRMHENFERTNDIEISADFIAPLEVNKITSNLRENRLAIVSGHNKNIYLAAALSAIRGMGYDERRCVEMKSFTDWNNIDPEYVDFVLLCDPFGKETYDKHKGKGMASIFDSIRDAVQDDRDGKKISVLIVSNVDALKECKVNHSHELLEEVVTVYDDTSESRPTDLTIADYKRNICSAKTTIIQNLSEQTNLYLEQNQNRVDPENLKAAKAILKKHKSVVLVGPRGSGKTSLAVALAASYMPSQVLLLLFPQQIEHVNPHTTHLVIIEDFAGKYGFDNVKLCDWYKTLDQMTLLKNAGKLNLIVTCDDMKLKKCLDKVAVHSLLENKVQLRKHKVQVKGENGSESVEALTTSQGNETNVVNEQSASQDSSDGKQPYSPSTMENSTVCKKKELLCLKCVLGDDAGHTITVKSMCLYKDKSLYIVVETRWKYFLIFHEVDLGYSVNCSLKYETDEICCINKFEIAVATRNAFSPAVIRVILLTDNATVVYTPRKSKKEFGICSALSCGYDGKIYSLWTNGLIRIFNMEMDVIYEYSLSQSFNYLSNAIVYKGGHVFISTGFELCYQNFENGANKTSTIGETTGCCICVASDDPFRIFVANCHQNSISQYNTLCEKVSDIPIDFDIVYGFQMVFDNKNKRLICHEQISHKIIEVYV